MNCFGLWDVRVREWIRSCGGKAETRKEMRSEEAARLNGISVNLPKREKKVTITSLEICRLVHVERNYDWKDYLSRGLLSKRKRIRPSNDYIAITFLTRDG